MIDTINSVINSFYYATFMPFIALFTLVLTILLFILSLKIKNILVKSAFFILITLLLLISYHVVPYFYTTKAVLSENKQETIKNYDKAIDTAVLPVHKGLLCLDYAASLARYKMPQEAKSMYEKAYYYLKEYKPSMQWTLAALFYTNIADYKKALAIYSSNNNFGLIAKIYILQNEYNNALEYSNKAVEKCPSAWSYAQRAAIYKKIRKINLAEQDFNKALLYAKQRDIEQLKYLYDNPESYYKEQIKLARRNLGL